MCKFNCTFDVHESWTACSRIGYRLNGNGNIIEGYLHTYKETFTPSNSPRPILFNERDERWIVLAALRRRLFSKLIIFNSFRPAFIDMCANLNFSWVFSGSSCYLLQTIHRQMFLLLAGKALLCCQQLFWFVLKEVWLYKIQNCCDPLTWCPLLRSSVGFKLSSVLCAVSDTLSFLHMYRWSCQRWLSHPFNSTSHSSKAHMRPSSTAPLSISYEAFKLHLLSRWSLWESSEISLHIETGFETWPVWQIFSWHLQTPFEGSHISWKWAWRCSLACPFIWLCI